MIPEPLVPENADPQSTQADQNKTEAQSNTGTTRTALQEGGDVSVYESLQSGNNKNDDDKTREADAQSQ